MTRISISFAAASMVLSLAERPQRVHYVTNQAAEKVANFPILETLRHGHLPAF